MRVSDFDFELPDELIAQHAAPRGESRLLALNRATGAVEHGVIGDLVRHLHEGDVLVANNTRVFPARLQGVRAPSGGAVECMLLEHDGAGDVWSALVHPGQKLKAGAQMRFARGGRSLMGEILERRFFGRRSVRLWSESGEPVESLIESLGHVPLPPYIKRADEPDDRERYQTVYAKASGSVAAPTAGLHFSAELLAALEQRGVEFVEVTLHVGYGTFKPVRTEVVEEHVVDPERYTISPAVAGAINDARRQRRRVIAVGTTTTRALESSAQGTGEVMAGSAEASIFIYPGFKFQIVDALLTNFHLPRSSLLMLVAAFAGRERILAAYREAVERRYRFYSYGDAMLIT